MTSPPASEKLFVYKRNLHRLEALSLIGLSLHGVALLSTQKGEPWQWILVAMTAFAGVAGMIGPLRRHTFVRLARILFVLVAGWFLMRASGGPGSFFFLWYIILTVTTSLAMQPPFNLVLPVVIVLAYLSLWVTSPSSTVPPLVIVTRAFLLLFLGGLGAWFGTLLRVQERQGPLSSRTHSLVTALGRVAAQLQTAPNLEKLYNILGHELRKLGVVCLVALGNGEDNTFHIEYISTPPYLITAAERLVGIRMKDLVLSSDNFPPSKALFTTKRPQIIENPLASTHRVLANVPSGVLKAAMRLVGLAEDALLIYLPLVVDGSLIGTLSLWGETLSKADLPVLELFADQLAAALHMNTLYEQLNTRREEELEIQLRFGQQLILAQDRQAVLDLTARIVQQALDADLVSIMQPDPAEKYLVLRGGLGWDPKLYGQYRVEIATSREGHVFRTGVPVQQEDVLSGKPFPCPVELAAHGVVSSLTAPLLGRGRTLGTLCVHSTRRRQFSPTEVRLLNALATQTALALERTLRMENLNQLYHLALNLSTASVQTEVAALISEAVAQVFNVPYVLLARFDPETNRLQGILPAFGLDADQVRAFSAKVSDELNNFWNIAEQPYLVIEDIRNAPDFVRALAAPYSIQSVLAVRVQPQEAPFGVLFVAHPQPNHFLPCEAQQVETYGRLAALTLDRIQKQQEERTSRQTMERLWQAALALNQSLELPVVLERILRELQKVIPYDSASVLQLRDTHTHWKSSPDTALSRPRRSSGCVSTFVRTSPAGG